MESCFWMDSRCCCTTGMASYTRITIFSDFGGMNGFFQFSFPERAWCYWCAFLYICSMNNVIYPFDFLSLPVSPLMDETWWFDLSLFLQVFFHEGFLHSICDDFLFRIWCSCLLAYITLLLDCSLCPYNEAPNFTHDQIQIYSVQHWKAGLFNAQIAFHHLPCALIICSDMKSSWSKICSILY